MVQRSHSKPIGEKPIGWSTVFTADTDYHELDSWSSLTGLSVVAMIIQEYGVELDSQDVRKADTIEDLFNLVNERQA